MAFAGEAMNVELLAERDRKLCHASEKFVCSLHLKLFSYTLTSMTETTFFTKIINREIPAQIIYEDDELIAILDKYPAAPTHILIIPRKPISTVNDLTDEDATLIGKMVLTAKKIAAERGLTKGYRLVMNCSDHGGQTIYHLHLHLLGGRPMHWPPG